ncbi:ABC protein [Mycena venus]|uniref:ABC protein n=1 Tax=Mycena venus TaxID=2733690 RepID=A0A8H6XU57_9AGAR|nr:ABC protein [Mycena venus]
MSGSGNSNVQVLLQRLLGALVPPENTSSAPNHLLETNVPPTEFELTATRELIAHEKSRLRALDANITYMKGILEVQLQQHHESKERIRRHESVVSPLRHFPPEILCRIFLFTVPSVDEMKRLIQDRSSKFGSGASPWILTHVCSRWRNICLSFPTLWRTIIIDVSLSNACDDDSDSSSEVSESVSTEVLEYPLDMLRAQLVRSRNAPLTILVEDPNPSQEILTALLSSSSRWNDVTFPDRGDFITSFPTQLPSVRKIHVTPGYGSFPFRPILLVTPALRHISLIREVHPYPLIFPWAQITRYQAGHSWNGHLDVLPLMGNLLECHLQVNYSSHSDIVQHATVIVPTLRKLYLGGGTPNHDNLVVPALEGLFILNTPSPEPFPWLRHCHRLKRLAITSNSSAETINKNVPTISYRYRTHRHTFRASDYRLSRTER